MGVKDLRVRRIGAKEGRAFIIEHHYSHGAHNGPMCWGLFDDERLVGVLAFATPASENVRRAVFGDGPCTVENCGYVPSAWMKAHPSGPHTVRFHVTELHRLVVLEEYGKNTESRFISQALKQLHIERPDVWAVLSFADMTEGHRGVIYQATNAIYTGTSGRATFFVDETGRLRHPRQCGINITKDVARERGWTVSKRDGKHRYLFLLGEGKRQPLQLPRLPYPRAVAASSDASGIQSEEGGDRADPTAPSHTR